LTTAIKSLHRRLAADHDVAGHGGGAAEVVLTFGPTGIRVTRITKP
jgi:hypothetical protein